MKRYQVWSSRGRKVGEAETVQAVSNLIYSLPRFTDGQYYFSVDSDTTKTYRITKYTFDIVGLMGTQYKTLSDMQKRG